MKIQIKSIFGEILFEYEKENNTIKETVIKANLSRADLSGSDLSRADLSGSDLSGANLSRADLSGANLSGSNLSGANLSRADLSGANLSGADLSGAKLPIVCQWGYGFIDDNIFIGCKEMSIDKWDIFFASENEFETKRNTAKFIEIQATYEALKTYKLFKEKNKIS